MNWTIYNTTTRTQIVFANELAIKLQSGVTKIITERANMVHYVKHDCTTLVSHFKVLS